MKDKHKRYVVEFATPTKSYCAMIFSHADKAVEFKDRCKGNLLEVKIIHYPPKCALRRSKYVASYYGQSEFAKNKLQTV